MWWFLVLCSGYRGPNLNLGPLFPGQPLLGFLYSSAELVIKSPVYPGQYWYAGTFTLWIPIPNDPSLIGANFYQQVLETITPYFNWLILSRGGHGVIGT